MLLPDYNQARCMTRIHLTDSLDCGSKWSVALIVAGTLTKICPAVVPEILDEDFKGLEPCARAV